MREELTMPMMEEVMPGPIEDTSAGMQQEVIGKAEIHAAREILQKYKQGKANLEKRIIDNEQWFKLRHWEQIGMPRADKDPYPASAWLFNSISNKHADAMDNVPEPAILPREEGDKNEAEVLTSILPMIMEQNEFESTYSDVWWYKLKSGTGVYGVFWNSQKQNGIGDIDIRKIDLLKLFWEPGIEDIQDSRNLFNIELVDNEYLKQKYPQLENTLGGSAISVNKYIYDDTVDTSEKSMVIDWYYKKATEGGDTVHYCKFVNEEILYASENDPAYAQKGFYDHGKYPFIFDVNIPLEGQPIGFGEIACGKGKQEWVDVLWAKIMENTEWSATARYFAELGTKVNLKDFCDPKKKIVEYTGTPDGLVRIETAPIHGSILQILDMLKDELKETTGARDAATGGTSGGVTAAQGIAIMSENSGKTSRDSNRGSYRAFAEVIEMVIELIRQFFDKPHYYRFSGEGYQGYIRYKNDGLNYQRIRNENGIVSNGEARHPLFDLEITVEKNSTYTRLQQNQLVLQLYSAGFFNPQNSASSLAALEMMDFDKKNEMLRKIRENDSRQQLMVTIAQENVQICAELDRKNAEDGITTNFTAQAQQKLAYIQQAMGAVKGASAPPSAPVSTTAGVQESSAITKAKERVAQSTSAM